MYAVFQALLDKYHVKVSDVAKATGINPSKFSDWKHGRSSPKADKLKLIADYFGVTTDYLMTLCAVPRLPTMLRSPLWMLR